MHIEESDGTPHTPERCAAIQQDLAKVGSYLVETRPHEADPVFLLNALVLLASSGSHGHLLTGWDHAMIVGAVLNLGLYFYRVVRVSRWEKQRDAWRERAP
jgi:hypothetical protein